MPGDDWRGCRGDASPRIIVTGGAGFVMSNVAHALLASNPAAQVLIVDIYEGDTLAEQFLAAFGSRVAFGFADVRDPRQLRDLGQDFDPTHAVINGAAVTHQPRLEVEQPSIYAEVNIMGTVNLLDWARGLPRLERFVHVSTGGVYGAPSPRSPLGSQPEDGPFDPPELYAVSKFAAELFVRRYRELFSLGTVRVRLADVFGPMERATGARSGMSLPYKMMRAALERLPASDRTKPPRAHRPDQRRRRRFGAQPSLPATFRTTSTTLLPAGTSPSARCSTRSGVSSRP